MNNFTRNKEPLAEEFNLRINEKNLAYAYSQGEYAGIASELSKWLTALSKIQLKAVNKETLALFDFSAEVIGHFLTRPDLNFTQKDFLKLLRLHQPLTNLFALSQYGNSDTFLKNIKFEEKTSILYAPLLTARNKMAFSRARLFSENSLVASEWYGQYLFGARSFASKVVSENLISHLSFWDERMVLCVSLSNGYMRSTYIDPNIDRHYKNNFNRIVQSRMSSSHIKSNPESKKIGVATARWAAVHPTYKNRFELFRELSKSFELTLIHIGPPRTDIDTTIFKNVIHAKFENGRVNAPELFNNDFGMLFYPDIGMNVESRFLSNLRLAPVQVTTNSHPVSTFGSKIDFFLTGIESEEDPTTAHRHYSERLVLIPGIGTLPEVPTSKVKRKEVAANTSLDSELIIACPWGSLKINHKQLCLLRRLSTKVKRRVRFRFLATLGMDSLHYPATLIDLQSVLGERVELFADLPYQEYMEKLADSHFAMDAFPFGGNTSIVDCLHLGIPIVTRMGWQFYNRAGPIILKRAGLDELIAYNEDDYIEYGCRLVNDSSLNLAIRQKMEGLNVTSLLSNLSSTDAFVAACSYLINHRPDPTIRTPIVIQ